MKIIRQEKKLCPFIVAKQKPVEKDVGLFGSDVLHFNGNLRLCGVLKSKQI